MKNRPIYWVLAASVGLFVLLMSLSPNHVEVNESHLPWNAAYQPNGELHALGLVLNKSTMKDVIDLYGRDIEVKLFEMPDGQKSAEGYLGSMYIGSIHASMVLKLKIDAEELDGYFARGARTTVSQQGAREVQLNSEDTLALFNYPIYEVTIVPRRNLSEIAIEKRFGQPDHIRSSEEGIASWFYLDKGLELILIADDKDILRYRDSQSD